MPRELIDTGTDKRYVRRDMQGRFNESDDVGRSHATDQKRDSDTKPSAAKATRATDNPESILRPGNSFRTASFVPSDVSGR
jgi:hypothetical protein